MRSDATANKCFSLQQAVLDAGGVVRHAGEGQTAFRWQGHPKAFILLISGRLTVHFRTRGRHVPWAECRAIEGQDCMPVTAAILSDRQIAVRAASTAPCRWIELHPTSLVLLVHGQMAFRQALFATHANRLPTFFARISSRNVVSLDQRIADWLLNHAHSGQVVATHLEIADDLLTAREVVSRKLRSFAVKGWIVQERGRIRLGAPEALARLSTGSFSACSPDTGLSENHSSRASGHKRPQ
ncbi:Crp/Fnr family transcriptional regulator [Hoeflea prorocentri]|uniref:Helix-turn-helix domain-containing protein n=1 Tax=Hoeflea prorocentri TaxID=1922333 RepID=A0A9X3UNN9_9HYPH|nr:helix-turn-helix domain-containing protein [Hoeflea prorocentri]MCY6383735.1 helix-turn-helix domain-containing protein [Hoeflea prorocentri]MDA5401535.1 helix-turn-helix domain-containing protein [Hoeflea prorocentri]